MKAIEILFPVFFMMFLGWLSHRRGWVTAGQNASKAVEDS